MTWTYRIVKTYQQNPCGTREIRYAIHEVYYGKGSEEIPSDVTIAELDRLGLSWTCNPISPETVVMAGEEDNPEEERQNIKKILERMVKACDDPIIDERTGQVLGGANE